MMPPYECLGGGELATMGVDDRLIEHFELTGVESLSDAHLGL